jgi:predicted amidohydrolase
MTFRLAAAQSVSVPGDLEANIAEHAAFIRLAAQARIDVLLFPELSLSGYEPDLLPRCALTAHSIELTPLRELVHACGVTVVLGAPLVADDQLLPHIGALTLFPDGRVAEYRKQFLHPGENTFASHAPTERACYDIGGVACALSICADSAYPEHAADAADLGAQVYLSSALISPAGYPADSARLRDYAKRHGYAVLLANHGAPTGGYASAGRSALWNETGTLMIEAPGDGRWLVVGERGEQDWNGFLVPAGRPEIE